MKYRLKKDLPLIKAGSEVRVYDHHKQKEIYAPVICWRGEIWCREDFIDELISDNWIEEIKPREFELGFTDDLCMSVVEIKDNVKQGAYAHWGTPTEIIRVYEIIK